MIVILSKQPCGISKVIETGNGSDEPLNTFFNFGKKSLVILLTGRQCLFHKACALAFTQIPYIHGSISSSSS
jgi:hypothetical protein